ncbi:MAG TPA: hypothetical protein VJ998_10870, partial [Pseudomonadales bacterium]|nr:hypothetical protein [Pseudomonadales bacterium]
MNLRYLQFGAVLLWGFQTGQLYFAIPIGLMLEARHFLNRRWALTKTDFYRIADLTSVVFVMLVVFLFLNRTRYHFITALVEWLPLIFFPLVLSLAYSTTTRMPLDVLFYSLRRQKAPVTQSWDMNYVYFGMCLVSAGTNTQGIHFYMLAASALVLAALFRLRSSRYPRNLWILIACIIFISAWFTQQGLRAGHLALKAATREWLANYIHQRINPLKTQSAIGSIGRLKLSDAIAFRVAPGKGDSPPALLQEATYDLYSDNDWMVLDPQFQRMPHADDFTWRFAPA